MNERPRMALASNIGFSRIYCLPCKSETLHQLQLCIHCGTAASVKRRVASKWQYKDGLRLKRSKA